MKIRLTGTCLMTFQPFNMHQFIIICQKGDSVIHPMKKDQLVPKNVPGVWCGGSYKGGMGQGGSCIGGMGWVMQWYSGWGGVGHAVVWGEWVL